MQTKPECLLKSYPDEHIMASIRRYPQHKIYFGSAEEQHHISFADLELKAQQLAATLRNKLGLKNGDVVAVLLPRTADFVISFYAIWLAGLIFMPLSNEWSNAFIDSRIKQSAAKCVIIDIRNANKIDQSEYQNVHFLTLAEALNDSQEKILHPENRTPEDDAYIYCSSGTTSEPKMITLPYAGIVPRIMGIIDEMKINAHDDVIMCFCDFGFDASLSEILMALFSGAQLVIAPQYVRNNPLDNLPRYLQTKPTPKPTATILIPSILRFIKDTKPYFPLQKILTTGEKCLLDWLKPLMAQGWEFWNGYGPTETTFGVTTTKIKPNDKMISLHNESMGLKLALIPRNDLNIEAGDNQCEVLIEGSGIGYYKNNIEKNNQCFKDLAVIGTRQFKTGDLVNVHSADAIEFTRRIDSRRKIFGEQIDLAQISTVIEKYNAIQKAELEVHDNTLIAYIQIKADSQFDPQAYQDHIDSHPDLKGKHRPSFSFTCKSASNPKPPYQFISAIKNAVNMNSNHKSTLQKIEQIWKDILLIGLSQELLDVVTLDHKQSFANLGGNSITSSLMATKVWNAFTDNAPPDKNWSRFFAYATQPDCSIDSLALYIVMEHAVELKTPKPTTLQHLESNNNPEQPIVLIRECYYSDKRIKPINQFANVPIYHVLISTSWLPEDMDFRDGEPARLLYLRILLLLDQIKSTRKIILIDHDSSYIKLTESDTQCKTMYLNFDLKNIDEKLASIIRKHQIKSLNIKLNNWRKKWLSSKVKTLSKIKIKLNTLQHINEVIGPPGSGKSDIIVNILNESSENIELIPLDLTGKATIAEALLDLELSEMETHYLKDLDSVLLIDNAELKLFTSETTHDPILLDQPKMKILFFTRQEYEYLHQESASQNPLSGKNYQQFKLPSNIDLNLGFYDNPLFKNFICNDNTLTAENLILALENWFEYDFKRHFQRQPKPIDFQQFIATLHTLERDYLREGIALCFDPSLSRWNNTKYFKHSLTSIRALATQKNPLKHALAALPYIEHIKPLLICTDPSKCLYTIPNVWLKILSTTRLFKADAPERTQPSTYFNVLNMATEKNRQFLDALPVAYQESIKQLSYVSGAPNVFIVYPLTGDIPRQFHNLKNHLDSYNCYAIYMHDVSFNDVANGRSHDLVTRTAFCAKVIRSIQNKGPYILAGWSFGGVLSYLISKQILSEGGEIACIINIDGGPPPVNLQTKDQVARTTHLICDLANRYRLSCADELITKISTTKFEKLDNLFNFSQGVLREHIQDSNVVLFSQHLQNIYDNIVSFYKFFLNSVKLPKLPIKMLLLTAGEKLLFVNDNVEMESWSELLTIDDKQHFEQNDHFNILCSEVYQFINSYLQRTVPSQSLENFQFMTPLDFVIIQKQHHLARAAQQFKKLKIMNKGSIIQDSFLEPTQSTTSLSTDRDFEICYHHLRFHKLEISDVSKKDGPILVFTVIKQFINSEDITQPLVHAIHGISGSGKSMVCEQIELDFLNDYKNQTSLWLPIRLPAEAFHAANLIKLSQTLQVNLKSLIAQDQAKLLFIIDNYDEACIEFIKDVLIYNQSAKIKFLITNTHDLLDKSFNSLYKVSCYKLTTPSVEAIEDCCEMHQKYHDPNYYNVYGELEEILNSNPIMRQLLNTPRNIRQLLPYINLIRTLGLNDEFSIYNLSMKLFFSNIEFHTKQRGVQIRPGLDLKKTSLQYAKELSFAIATKDTHIAHYNHNDADTQALKELCRVSFSEYSASFEAPLFYYLQLANYLLDTLNHNESDAFLTLLNIDLAPLTLTLDFMAEFIRANSTHNSTITSNLLEILFNKNTGKPTSNAMSILGRCYHNFGGLYFANLKFNTANLDGVILDGSYMKDCSLANVDISRTSIRHCQFNNTALTDSTVNSYQIETETAPKLIMLSHNGKYLAYLMHYHKYMTLKIINLHEGNCIFDEKILQTDFLDKASCLFTTDDDHFLLILHNQIITFDLHDVKNIKRLNTTTDNNSDLIGIFSSIQSDNSLIIGKSYEDGSLELSLRTTNPGEKSFFENSITQTSVNQQLCELLSKDEVMINPCRMLGLNGWIFTPGAFTLLPIVEENVVKFWTNTFQNREVSAMTSKNQYCLIATIINSTSVSIQKFPGNDTVYCETTKAYHGIYQLQFAFDATILIGTTHSSLLVWDVETGALLENCPTHHNEVMNFTVAENAQLLAYTVYECANKINIFKVTQYNQPKQQEKFIAIADDGRYSLWQISSQRYQLRVNGGRTVVPIELNYHTAPITHKLKPFIAYKIGSELIVKRFDRKNSCTYQITTPLMPLYFIDDKFLALAEFLHPKQLTAIFDLTTQSIISPQTTIPIIPRYELAKNQLICYETPQTNIKWKADLQSHYTPHSMVISADEELIAISFPNGRIHIYSGHDGKFLDELVITYLSFDYLKNLYIHITQQHDIIITDDDNHQWYWRNKKMIWSATPATTHTATGALLDHQSTHNPSLNQRLTFFGAQHSNQPLTTQPSQNELLLVILQRFYGVGIHANIKNIQYARDESNLTITVDDVYEDRVIYLPKTVANAAIPHLDLETIGIANNNKQ